MRLPFLAAAAALLALGTAGCDSAVEPDPVVLFPLEVGNRWIMTFAESDTTGRVFWTSVDTVAVTRDTLVDGERWYYVGLVGRPDDRSTLRGFYANRPDGLYKLVRQQDGARLPTRYFSTVTPPGTTYDLPVSYGYGSSYAATMTVVSTEDPYELPGTGAVPAYHFRQTFTEILLEGYPFPIDVRGLVVDFRFLPAFGPLQHQNVSVFGGRRLDWQVQERVNA